MEEQIARLAVGQAISEDGIRVKRHADHSYSLDLAANRYSNRWGTLGEILVDYAFTASAGHLPQPAGQSWF